MAHVGIASPIQSNGTTIKPRIRLCCECDRRIPLERLRLLPETWTCVRCSAEQRLTEESVLGGSPEDGGPS